jgi:protein phosphatase
MAFNDEDTIEERRSRKSSQDVVADWFVESGVEVAALTHQGYQRRINEDQFAVLRRTRSGVVLASSLANHNLLQSEQHSWLLAVADGLGGNVAGEVASATAMTTILRFSNNLGTWIMQPTGQLREDVEQRVELYAQAVQKELKQQAEMDPSLAGMATTLTTAYIFGTNAVVVNLGDSRSYLVRSEEIHQITCDHTIGSALERDGFPPEVVRPYRNILNRCFNTGGESVNVDLFHLDLQDDDRILLCTDGLTDLVDDATIRDLILVDDSGKKAAERLVKMALHNGGRDNITLVLARVHV